MKKIIKNAIKLVVFISLASLPFISVTQIIGLEAFIDSFENSDYYLCLQDQSNVLGTDTKNGEFIIMQKASHPDFEIKKSDSIIYCKNNGEIVCNKVYSIAHSGNFNKYYMDDEQYVNKYPIYEEQVVGKVINIVDDNLWNSISITAWETSINNLNVRALTSN